MKNLIGVGFKGIVYPVNPFTQSIQGIMAYPSIKKIPWQVDLAVIATPAHIVPQIVEECGESGVVGIIILSSGFRETGPAGRKLEEEILRIKDKYGMRIIGPNCLGVMRPSIKLNATFAKKMAKPGRIAFISQSGALCASVLDWASQANVGFSNIVSVGSMLDVDFADLIDYFGIDPETRSIVLFIEAIKDARKFISAARRFASTKPIIVIKAGKSPEGGRAVASHTGAIAGEDRIYDAAFRRAGIVRVEEITDLFNCSEILSMQRAPKGSRLIIVTNAGGPGVIATDYLISKGGRLADLSAETTSALNRILPSYWSRSNPIDIGEDATVERFKEVLEICFKEPAADGFLVIYTPIGAAEPIETAEALIDASRETEKPILTCWLGGEDVEEARELLCRNGIPTYSTPEQAISTFMYMYQYSRNLRLLYETPEELPVDTPINRDVLEGIIRNAAREEREVLTEPESKRFLEAYGIPTVKAHIAKTVDEALRIASRIGYPVTLKILSPQITHKSECGGVALNLNTDLEVERAFKEIIKNVKGRFPSAIINGVTVQRMIQTNGYELIIGSKRDPHFGSVIILGAGGVNVELYNDVAVEFPPLNQTLAKRMIEQTRIYRFLRGYRGRKPVNLKLLEEILVRFSQLIIDFPQIKEADINPLIIDEEKALALDARIIIDRESVFKKIQPYKHLIIKPYPKRYVSKWRMKDGREVLLRPIKPEDEPLIRKLFETFSEETMRFRFFQIIREISHETLARYCNIDYDREMTIVAEIREGGERRIIGMVRLVVEPDLERGEIAIVIGDPWQNLGLGTKMLDYIIDIGRDMNLKMIFGEILAENTRMIHLCYKRGFRIEKLDEETYIATIKLK